MLRNKINVYYNNTTIDIESLRKHLKDDTRIIKIDNNNKTFLSIHFKRFIYIESEFKTFITNLNYAIDKEKQCTYKYIYNDAILYEKL